MSGTKAGGAKAAATNKRLHGDDFYKRIGKKGGRNGRGAGYKGGFASSHELARTASAKGGKISKRGPAKKDGKDKAKKTETIETPEHGKQENIHLWHRMFRKGEDA
mgnify:CR=1 FL=1